MKKPIPCKHLKIRMSFLHSFAHADIRPHLTLVCAAAANLNCQI